jgi:hypothetical protein
MPREASLLYFSVLPSALGAGGKEAFASPATTDETDRNGSNARALFQTEETHGFIHFEVRELRLMAQKTRVTLTHDHPDQSFLM